MLTLVAIAILPQIRKYVSPLNAICIAMTCGMGLVVGLSITWLYEPREYWDGLRIFSLFDHLPESAILLPLYPDVAILQAIIMYCTFVFVHTSAANLICFAASVYICRSLFFRPA